MLAFGRMIGAFGLMMAIGYLAVVAFLPAPDMTTGRSASAPDTAARLAQEAQALVTRKAPSSFQ